MNYIKHLSGFFEKVSKDDRLNPTHISLYVSLFQFWNACRFHNPISISRQEAMNVSKISSKVTYHKCIRELHEFGYLRYMPSYNPFKGSLVYLYDFQSGTVLPSTSNQQINLTASELVPNSNHKKIVSGTEQVLIPYTNNSNNTKQKTIVNAQSKNKSDEKNNYSKSSDNELSTGTQKKEISKTFGAADFEKSSGAPNLQKKKKNSSNDEEQFSGEEISIFKNEFQHSAQGFQRPLRSETKIYFAQNHWPEKEADKFYNHYESNGWMIGKTPMANWYAAASNWMLNSENFNNEKANTRKSESNGRSGNLHTSTGKDYSEPL